MVRLFNQVPSWTYLCACFDFRGVSSEAEGILSLSLSLFVLGGVVPLFGHKPTMSGEHYVFPQKATASFVNPNSFASPPHVPWPGISKPGSLKALNQLGASGYFKYPRLFRLYSDKL